MCSVVLQHICCLNYTTEYALRAPNNGVQQKNIWETCNGEVLWLCCTACMVLAVCCRHCCEHYHLMLVWLPTHCITIAAAADAGYRMCCGLNKGHFAAQACGTVCMLHGSMRDYLCLVTVASAPDCWIAGMLLCCCMSRPAPAAPARHLLHHGFRNCCVLWPRCANVSVAVVYFGQSARA